MIHFPTIEWSSILKKLSNQFEEVTISNWLSKLKLLKYDEKYILVANTSFIKNWINTYYLEKIRSACSKYDEKFADLEIFSVEDNLFNGSEEIFKFFNEKPENIIYDKHNNFDTFIRGKSNEFSYQIARKITNNALNYSGFYFYGESGVGKTHLLKSIQSSLSLKSSVKYTTAEDFMIDFIDSVKNKNIVDFKKKIRSYDVLIIDDIDFLEGKSSTQQEFLHTISHFYQKRKKIIFGSKKSIYSVKLSQEIQSSFMNNIIVKIENHSYDIKMSYLKQNSNRSVRLLKAIALNSGNIPSLSANLTNIRLQYGEKFKLENINSYLSVNKKTIEDEKIVKGVQSFFKIQNLTIKSRKKEIVKARNIAMFLIKEINNTSYKKIASTFKKKSHTTIMHGVRKIEKDRCDLLKAEIEKIKAYIYEKY